MKQKLIYISSLYELYEIIGIISLSLALCFGIKDILSISFPVFFVLITAIAWVFLFRFIEDNRNKFMTYLILMGILILVFMITGFFGKNFITLLAETVNYGMAPAGSQMSYNPGYGYLLGCGLGFVTGISSYFICRMSKIKQILAGVFFILLILAGVFGLELGKISLTFILFYCLINLAEFSGNKNQTTHEKNSLGRELGNPALYLLPFFFFMSIFIMILPSKEEPIRWKAVKTALSIMADLAQDTLANIKFGFGSDSEYSITFSGYSDKGKLGGEITKDSFSQLQYNGKQSKGNVYLIGSVYDFYTGSGWIKKQVQEDQTEGTISDDQKNKELEYQLDCYEFLYGIEKSNCDIALIKEGIGLGSAELLFQEIRTSTLFYPQKAYYIGSDRKYAYNARFSNIVLKKSYDQGLLYKIRYLDIDYSNTEIIKMLQAAEGNWDTDQILSSDTVLENVSNDFSKYNNAISMELPDNINSYLKNRSIEINKNYIELPDTIPERVKELTLEITKNCNNTYDKCKAIEAYLNKYTYTTTPPDATGGVDFVDTFLFDTQEGYCTYFATAMAVMGRTIGLPTRYVEGFCLDYSNEVGKDCYLILNTDAHAWCEVYIEGAGWIPFEPTSGRSEIRYKKWSDNMESQTIKTSGIYPPVKEDDVQSQVVVEKESVNVVPYIIIFTYLVVFGCLFMIVYYIILKKQRTRRYQLSDENQRILLQFMQILKLIELLEENELLNSTVTEIFNHIKDQLKLEMEKVEELRGIYLQLRYSDKMANASDTALYEDIRRQLEVQYFTKCNLLNRLQYKMFKTVL